jgi:hypothetical protein
MARIDGIDQSNLGQNGDRRRQRMREQHQRLLRKMQEISHQQEKYFFEGKWRTQEEVRHYHRELQRKDRQIFREVMAVCFILLLLTGLLGLFLYAWCC